MMQCPACGHKLTAQKIKHITLHICDGGCGGVWFHWRDLETFDEPQAAIETPYTIQKNKRCTVSHSLQYHCPHCTNLVMRRRFIRVIEEVLIDECPSCCGIWLNGDEFEEIRNQFEQALLEGSPATEVVEDGFLNDETGVDNTCAKRDRRFINACRFLCPVHYVKQRR